MLLVLVVHVVLVRIEVRWVLVLALVRAVMVLVLSMLIVHILDHGAT